MLDGINMTTSKPNKLVLIGPKLLYPIKHHFLLIYFTFSKLNPKNTCIQQIERSKELMLHKNNTPS